MDPALRSALSKAQLGYTPAHSPVPAALATQAWRRSGHTTLTCPDIITTSGGFGGNLDSSPDLCRFSSFSRISAPIVIAFGLAGTLTSDSFQTSSFGRNCAARRICDPLPHRHGICPAIPPSDLESPVVFYLTIYVRQSCPSQPRQVASYWRRLCTGPLRLPISIRSPGFRQLLVSRTFARPPLMSRSPCFHGPASRNSELHPRMPHNFAHLSRLLESCAPWETVSPWCQPQSDAFRGATEIEVAQRVRCVSDDKRCVRSAIRDTRYRDRSTAQHSLLF
jgi:hypothetical protein